MKFQRGFEAEADYLGLQYMYKTGYDPQAFVSFFEKIQAKEKKKPGRLPRRSLRILRRRTALRLRKRRLRPFCRRRRSTLFRHRSSMT